MERIRVDLLARYPLATGAAAGALPRRPSSAGPRVFVHLHERGEDVRPGRRHGPLWRKMERGQHEAQAQRKLRELAAGLKLCVEEQQRFLDDSLDKERERSAEEFERTKAGLEARLGDLLREERDLLRKISNFPRCEVEAEREQLMATLRTASRASKLRKEVAALRKEVFELESKIVRDQRRLETAHEYIATDLPRQRETLSRSLVQNRTAEATLRSSIESYERALSDLEEQDLEVRLLAAIYIQAMFRGYRVRRRIEKFRLDQEDLKLCAKLLCRKLGLQLPLLQSVFLSRDHLSNALEPELTCRFCFQVFQRPVWTPIGGGRYKTYCEECARQVLSARVGNHRASDLLRNRVFINLQDRLEEKQRRYELVCMQMDRLKSDLAMHEQFESLLTRGLQPEHLQARLEAPPVQDGSE